MTSVSLLSTLISDYKSALAKSSEQDESLSSVSSILDNSLKKDDSACSIDLSKAAQDILNSGKTPEESGSITLTYAQKQKLSSILDKYKDASPEDEEALTSLYNDLKQAGLDPDQLAATHEALSFKVEDVFLRLISSGDSGSSDVSSVESKLSGLGSPASGTPLGDLFDIKA